MGYLGGDRALGRLDVASVGAGACALGAVVHNFGVAVGRWSLIGVRAAGLCLYTEARILHFALITALAARARSERRGGVRGKSQNIQIKTEDRQGNDAERSQCQILICPKRPIASVHKPKQEPMKHLEKRMETCTHRSKKIKSRINKTAAELELFSPRQQPRIPLNNYSFYTPGH